jgi:hypothetical protein
MDMPAFPLISCRPQCQTQERRAPQLRKRHESMRPERFSSIFRVAFDYSFSFEATGMPSPAQTL